MARELLDEEGVAARLRVDRGDGAGRRRRAPISCATSRSSMPSRRTRGSSRPRSSSASSSGSGWPGCSSESRNVPTIRTAPSRGSRGDVAGEQQRRPVGPVQVVDDHQHRAVRGEPAHDRHDGAEHLAAPRLRLAHRRQAGEVRQALVDLRQQPGQLGGAPDELGELGLRHAGEVRAQHVDPGAEREQLLLVAAAVEHLEPRHPVRQLRDDARLADAALAADQHEPGLAGGGPLGPLAEPAQGRVATDPRRGERLREPVGEAVRPVRARRGGAGRVAVSSRSCRARTASPGTVPSSSRSSTRRRS